MAAMSLKQQLATTTRLLIESGDFGQQVVAFGEHIEDPWKRLAFFVNRLKVFQNLSGSADKFKKQEIPVGIRQFIESPEYLNKAGERNAHGEVIQPVIFETIMVELEELNNGHYVESVLTGSIGTGKTSMAIYTQAYQLYLLSRLENPHREFGLDPSSEIEIVFQSMSASLAKMVDFDRFKALLDASPYFQTKFPYDPNYLTTLRFPNHIIVRPVHGGSTAALGQNVIGGIIDELNLMAITENSKQVHGGGVHDQATENYNSIARRRESRFMVNGFLPGMLCLVSSKQYQGQFTDKKIEEAKKQGPGTRIFVFDKKLWEIKPANYSRERFLVFIGDQSRRPRILKPGESLAGIEQDLILEVPIDFRTVFEQDIFNALRDIGGTSTQVVSPFMPNFEAVHASFGKTKSLLSLDAADLVDERPLLYVKRFQQPDEPRFAHIDLAYSNDSAGLAVGWCPGFKEVKRDDFVEVLPIIQYDLLLEIRPPRGGEIDFSAIRRILYGLRAAGLHLKWCTLDSFQSKDTMQNLQKKGISTGLQSMDVKPDAYVALKSALYDGRVLAPAHELAEKELLHLEWDAKKKKVDHPPKGSKDISDAMAGVAYGLLMRREIWFKHGQISKIPAWIVKQSREAEKNNQSDSKAHEQPLILEQNG